MAYIFACESSPVPGLRILEVARLEESGKSVPIETKFPPMINATALSTIRWRILIVFGRSMWRTRLRTTNFVIP